MRDLGLGLGFSGEEVLEAFVAVVVVDPGDDHRGWDLCNGEDTVLRSSEVKRRVPGLAPLVDRPRRGRDGLFLRSVGSLGHGQEALGREDLLRHVGIVQQKRSRFHLFLLLCSIFISGTLPLGPLPLPPPPPAMMLSSGGLLLGLRNFSLSLSLSPHTAHTRVLDLRQQTVCVYVSPRALPQSVLRQLLHTAAAATETETGEGEAATTSEPPHGEREGAKTATKAQESCSSSNHQSCIDKERERPTTGNTLTHAQLHMHVYTQ